MTSRESLPFVHQVNAPADFLAIVPHLVGRRLQQSVVVVPFGGGRSIGALRFELSAARRVDALDAVLQEMRVFGRPDVARIVLYTDDQIGVCGPLPEADTAQLVVSRARALGIMVDEAWCVASDGWGDYLANGGVRRSASELIEAQDRLPAEVPQLRSIAEQAALPEPPAAEIDAVRAEVDALRMLFPHGVLPDAEQQRVAATLRSVGLGTRPASSAENTARFLLMVQQLDQRRELQLQALWATHRGTRDRLVRPAAERLDRVVGFAARAAACAAELDLPAALSFLAILHWLAGRGSVADHLASRALELDPHDSTLAETIVMIGAGVRPAWQPSP